MKRTATYGARCLLLCRAAPKHFLFTLVLIITVIFNPAYHANAKEYRCLVLIRLEDKWVAYDRLAEISPSGNIMLQAKLFSNAIGFSYKEDNSEEQLTITKSKKNYNLYTINKTKYVQYSNNSPIKEEYASYPVYLSKNSAAIVIQSDTIDNLCYHKLFVGNEISEYNKIGYDAVLCFSTFADITDLPKVDLKDPEGPIKKYITYANLPATTGQDIDTSNNEIIQIDNQVINTTVLRNKLVEYAKQAKKTKYVYGGNDLSKGVDTSGFIQAIYKKIGYNLPKVSKDQLSVGEVVSINYINPGDLVFYGDKEKELVNHVGIYIGNNKIIHAKNKKEGVTISDINYKQPYCAVRIISD